MDDMPQLKRKHPLSALPDCHAGEIQLRDAIQSKLIYALGKSSESATANDWYQATVLAVRDQVVDIWRETRAETKRLKKKRVYYLSICLLYTSDAADDLLCVDLGGRRIIKKK